MAKDWKVRPSSLLAIEDELAAYCFDEATWAMMNVIEEELEKIQSKNPNQEQALKKKRLYEILGLAPRGVFADPLKKG